MAPKVSVIMPSLNVIKYIEKCLKSVLTQTLNDIEILCVDAGSTDGTLEVLQEYEKKDARMHVIISSVKSYGFQVNEGIHQAKGEYVAIVETDDYIDSFMYEYLYKIAIEKQVDYVKADFDSFVILSNNAALYTTTHLFNSNNNYYNTVINPVEINQLYYSDYNLWKGIYRRQFLLDNKIRLNETKGAAYQDIGFAELVLSHAKRAYYSDKSFYRYYLGRSDSSSNSLYGLLYSYNEFKRLIEMQQRSSIIKNKKGFYIHMATSFLGEYKMYLKRSSFKELSGEWLQCYNWFCYELKGKIKEELLEKTDFPSDVYNELMEVLYSREDFKIRLKSIDDSKKSIIKEIKERQKSVVIYGAGKKGKHVLVTLDANNILVDAFADTYIRDRFIANIPVLSLKESVEKYSDSLFVIANKNDYLEMKNCYLKTGGKEDLCMFAWD